MREYNPRCKDLVGANTEYMQLEPNPPARRHNDGTLEYSMYFSTDLVVYRICWTVSKWEPSHCACEMYLAHHPMYKRSTRANFHASCRAKHLV